MPRRYYAYVPEFQVLHVLSSAGALVLGVGFLMPLFYLAWSIKYGKPAPNNPWTAVGLEWQTSSPPPTENFTYDPVVKTEAYEFEHVEEIRQAAKAASAQPA
jgi:cytochrome c oxidase subunit 1